MQQLALDRRRRADTANAEQKACEEGIAALLGSEVGLGKGGGETENTQKKKKKKGKGKGKGKSKQQQQQQQQQVCALGKGSDDETAEDADMALLNQLASESQKFGTIINGIIQERPKSTVKRTSNSQQLDVARGALRKKISANKAGRSTKAKAKKK
jgi:hypothetical protein